MVATENSWSAVSILGFLILLKVGIIIVLFLYLIFAGIILRQVMVMTEVVVTDGAPIARFLAVLHLGVALGVSLLILGLLLQ